jgi:hypothetical protein
MTQQEPPAYSIKFHGGVLKRGFWLYVVDIRPPAGRYLYVGRTGDSSSANASSPFVRIGQHLDSRPNAKGNTLSRNLRQAGIDPSLCGMEMIAIGPIFPEEHEFASHRPIRDQVAALEYALAQALRERGHRVLGKHSAPCGPDVNRLTEIIRAIDTRLSRGVE